MKSPTNILATFAICEWPQEHPDRHIMGKPAEVWCKTLSEGGINCFVLIENILSRVIIATECLNEEHVLVVIPLIQ